MALIIGEVLSTRSENSFVSVRGVNFVSHMRQTDSYRALGCKTTGLTSEALVHQRKDLTVELAESRGDADSFSFSTGLQAAFP